MKSLTRTPNLKWYLTLDAIRWSFELERKLFEGLTLQLRSIEREDDGRTVPEVDLVLSVISSCWFVLDTVYRIHTLFKTGVGIKKKIPAFQLFVRATSAVEEFRHHYQHLNTEINQLKSPTSPVFGSISWVSADGATSRTICLGALAHGITLHTLPLDTFTGNFVGQVLFSAGSRKIDLLEVHAHCIRASRELELDLAEKGYLSDEELKTSAFRFERVLIPDVDYES